MEEKVVYFASTYDVGKTEHGDYCSVTYGYPAKMLPVLTAFSLFFHLGCPLLGSGFGLDSFLMSGFLFLCTGFLHLLAYWSIQNGYKRNLLAYGKDCVRFTIQFSDKMVLSSEFHTPMEYDYSQIKIIRQTKLFYMLGLGQNMHIIVPMDIAPQQPGMEFIPFITERCTNLKRKKIRDLSHAKSISFACVCVNATVVVINLLMMVVL